MHDEPEHDRERAGLLRQLRLGPAAGDRPPLPEPSASRPPRSKKGEHYKVIMVAEDSVGAAAGFQVGDELVSIDGVPIDEKET